MPNSTLAGHPLHPMRIVAPGDAAMEHAMLAAEKYVPANGPVMR